MSFLLPSHIKFYLSGGTNNVDPTFSIGGPISNTEIIDNILHNLFDRVITKEAAEGDVEWRCFYIKNTHPNEIFKGVRIWIESGTSSSKTFISLGIGHAGVNQQEILIPNENTDPAIVAFSIPLSPPEQPNIGDLGPGDHIGIWIRYTIQEGAEERSEDKAILRIEGERAPIDSFTPPIVCPQGQHYDPNINACVPVTTIPECPPGFHYDLAIQNCVLDSAPPVACPAGTHWDPNTLSCIPENQIPTCPAGFHYDESVQNCVPDGNPPPVISLFNITAAGDFTCSNNGEATMNTMADFMDTSQDVALLLGDFSYVDGDQSCFIELTDQVFGAAFPNRLYPVIGNHDDTEDGQASDRDDIIDTYPAIPSQGYYSFTKGNVRFIMMDTQSNLGTGSSQYSFVQNELRIADSDPSILWIIVCYHKPSITPDTDHAPLTNVRDNFHPLFDQYHVDLVLTGHNHNYSRSKPVRHNSSSPNTPTVMDNGNTSYTDIDGRIYITAGHGGRSLDAINDNPAWLAASNDSDHGALLISLTETVQGRGNQLSCIMRTNNGDDDDSFTITKSASPIPPGGGGGGGSGGGAGGIDEFGIQWMAATGSQDVVDQSRNDPDDFRWSQNFSNIENGYEATLYFTFTSVASGGHIAAKLWGPNHTSPCGYEESGDCCCWYDYGIRENGDIQLQTERPHPSNHNHSVPSSMQFMDNIGVSMDNRTIGLKWLIYPIQIDGDVENGGMKIKMWVDTAGFSGGKPQNVWRLALDITDTGQILGDMPALSTQEVEIRNSDTDDTTDYGGGVHVRYLRRPQDIP